MAGNAGREAAGSPQAAGSSKDRRVLRTRDALGDALLALMSEKTFDAITVGEVLDRAGVGRSTFYKHYRDKEDLFLSDVEDFFEHLGTLLNRTGAAPERVLPLREFFAHVAGQHDFLAAMKASGKLDDVLELGRGIFARSAEERMKQAGVGMMPAELSAHAAAWGAGAVALLSWWIDHGMRETPEEMDTLFHRMVWRGVGRRRSAAVSV